MTTRAEPPVAGKGNQRSQIGRTDWPAAPEDWAWEQKLAELRLNGLEGIRATATAWEASTGTLLGVFAAVAFVKGPDTFTDLGGVTRWVAAAAVLLAGVSAASALVWAAMAGQGIPREYSRVDGEFLKRWTLQRSRSAIGKLWWSRVLAITAVMLVLVATTVTWASHFSQPSTKPVFVFARLPDGTLACGALESGKTGALLVSSGSETVRVPVKNARSVVIVDSCP